MSDHGDVLRALVDRTDWRGDDGVRDAVCEAIDRLDPPSVDADGAEPVAKSGRTR